MEPPEPTSAKFKLWRWLLLLCVITVALGGFASWKVRSERLEFIEPIWTDSLAGHEKGFPATGERRKIGEVWSLTRWGGLSFIGRGVSRDFEGRFPVFTESEAVHGTLSKRLLAEMRGEEELFINFDRSNWWNSIRIRGDIATRSIAIQVLFCTDRAVTLRERTSEFTESERYESLEGRSFVNRNGEWRVLHRDELFNGKDWVEIVSDFCVADLRRQDPTRFEPPSSFDYHNLNQVSITPAGLHFYPYGFEVLIPFEKLAEHLRPDGPHRLFQTKVGE